MKKRILLSGVAVFVLWSLLDFVIHGMILKSTYASTAFLWRPMAEMKIGLMYVTVFIAAMVFAPLYGWFVGNKNLRTGLKFGLLYGIAFGVGMGYGSYSVMPIPYFMALTWFLGTVVEATLAGLLVGQIIREQTIPPGSVSP
jgi:hypothetical protein